MLEYSISFKIDFFVSYKTEDFSQLFLNLLKILLALESNLHQNIGIFGLKKTFLNVGCDIFAKNFNFCSTINHVLNYFGTNETYHHSPS